MKSYADNKYLRRIHCDLRRGTWGNHKQQFLNEPRWKVNICQHASRLIFGKVHGEAIVSIRRRRSDSELEHQKKVSCLPWKYMELFYVLQLSPVSLKTTKYTHSQTPFLQNLSRALISCRYELFLLPRYARRENVVKVWSVHRFSFVCSEFVFYLWMVPG